MYESMTEYQKGAFIVNAIVNGNEATIALNIAVLRTIQTISDPNETWLEKIDQEKRVPRELAMKALYWELVKDNKKYIEKEDQFINAVSAFISAVTTYLDHNPSTDEIKSIILNHEDNLKKMEQRNTLINSFDQEIRERRYTISQARKLADETPLSRIIRERKASTKGREEDEKRRREEKSLADAMSAARAWQILNDRKVS